MVTMFFLAEPLHARSRSANSFLRPKSASAPLLLPLKSFEAANFGTLGVWLTGIAPRCSDEPPKGLVGNLAAIAAKSIQRSSPGAVRAHSRTHRPKITQGFPSNQSAPA